MCMSESDHLLINLNVNVEDDSTLVALPLHESVVTGHFTSKLWAVYVIDKKTFWELDYRIPSAK